MDGKQAMEVRGEDMSTTNDQPRRFWIHFLFRGWFGRAPARTIAAVNDSAIERE